MRSQSQRWPGSGSVWVHKDLMWHSRLGCAVLESHRRGRRCHTILDKPTHYRWLGGEMCGAPACEASAAPRVAAPPRLYNRPMNAPSGPTVTIEKMNVEDWDAVRAIYEESIATGHATFEQASPAWEKWDSGHLAACRLVARAGADVLGWAALSPVSGRCVYAGVAEVSVYVAARARKRKLGSRLLSALVAASENAGLWTLQAGIFPENVPSIELHKRCGFRVVGIRERLGCVNGRWRDVVLMERRSAIVGAGTEAEAAGTVLAKP
jgi:L-amino acid N-acyltransferase YncA